MYFDESYQWVKRNEHEALLNALDSKLKASKAETQRLKAKITELENELHKMYDNFYLELNLWSILKRTFKRHKKYTL